MNKIIVKKFNKDLPDLNLIEKGDWIDLYVARGVAVVNDEPLIELAQNNKSNSFIDGKLDYARGDILILGLGVAMQLPKGCEATIIPRSSTFKKYGLILSNSMGLIDNSYCGDSDEWQAMFYATRSGRIKLHDRLVQFRIQEKMNNPQVKYVDFLGNKDRGGYGSSGR